MTQNLVIMGAAGRDFHNFNLVFRDNPAYRVVAFTAAQIPEVNGRRYPAQLAGALYPQGIPILGEEDLEALLRKERIDLVVFAYSDIAYEQLMHKAALSLARGADFMLLGTRRTQLKAQCPVVSVGAVRTGCGKSSVTRKVCALAESLGLRPVVVRHPMPYGDLLRQAVQRFSSYEDLAVQQCTIEEREEYEPLLERGLIVYAGIDYQKILHRAQAEADLLVWDGGNNDLPFFRPDVHIVLLDPHRPGHETRYYPGESNLLSADIAVIAKTDSAEAQGIAAVQQSIAALRPQAAVVLGRSELVVEDPERIRGRRVLVVEDGPSLTHGGMSYGAAMLAARRFGAAKIVDPRPFAQGSLVQVFADYPHLQKVMPAMGYAAAQMRDLQESINATPCDLVLYATPSDLARLLTIRHASLRIGYEYVDAGSPSLEEVLLPRLSRLFEGKGERR